MVKKEDDLKSDKITISLQWTTQTHDNFSLSYGIIVLPMANAKVTMINNNSANVTLPYNAIYNVSVVADFCGRSNATMHFEVYYGKCTTKY